MTDYPGDDGNGPVADARTPSDAFQGLADKARTAVLRALARGEPRTFSALHDASGVETSAGFAYHLRQLDGRFVRQREDERYELTAAGRAVARGMRSGIYTASIDRGPVDLDDRCPFCGETTLVAHVVDNVTEVSCEECATPLLSLSLPPGGYTERDADSLPAALDAYYRHRIRSYADGVCPDCSGTVNSTVEPAAGGELAETLETIESDHDGTAHELVQVAFDCEGCGGNLRCPLTLTVLDHRAVVAFYRDHDENVDERPIWNVGREWREHVVSRDPWCLLVSTRLDDDVLDLYVDGTGTVVEHRRRSVEDSLAESTQSGADATVSGRGADEDQRVREERPGDDATA